MRVSNIDRQDSALTTAYPFALGTSTKLGTLTIADDDIINISLQIYPGIVPPARISSAETDEYGITLVFSDVYDKCIGSTYLELLRAVDGNGYRNAFIRRSNGIVTGHITVTRDLIRRLHTMVRLNGGTCSTERTAMVLDMHCLVAAPPGVFKCIELDGACNTTTVYIAQTAAGDAPEPYTTSIDKDSDTGTVSITIVSDTTSQAVATYGITHIYVGGIAQYATNSRAITGVDTSAGCISFTTYDSTYAKNTHVLLRHKKLSNLRVCTAVDTNTITLTGVKDV